MMITRIPVPVKAVNKSTNQLPKLGSIGASGVDIQAFLQESITIEAGGVEVIPTGIFVEIPAGFEIQVRSRSGLAAKHSVFVLNSPGTIDSDYRGELKVILKNASAIPFTVNNGDRVAQLVLQSVPKIHFVEVEALTETTRGEGGFGSTGIKELKDGIAGGISGSKVEGKCNVSDETDSKEDHKKCSCGLEHCRNTTPSMGLLGGLLKMSPKSLLLNNDKLTSLIFEDDDDECDEEYMNKEKLAMIFRKIEENGQVKYITETDFDVDRFDSIVDSIKINSIAHVNDMFTNVNVVVIDRLAEVANRVVRMKSANSDTFLDLCFNLSSKEDNVKIEIAVVQSQGLADPSMIELELTYRDRKDFTKEDYYDLEVIK